MVLTAPYNNAMRLGQGFNTFTQDIRLNNAVKFKSKPAVTAEPPTKSGNVPEGPSMAPSINVISPPATPQQTSETFDAAVVAAESRPKAESTPTTASTEPTSIRSLLQQSTDSTPSKSEPLQNGKPVSQKVTFSTRAIENISDIMDALNISAAMSISYGTIHGNGSAAFVNENKVLDSQLNYVVSVTVNNDEQSEPDDAEFFGIDDLPPEEFTKVYGDSFISGFMEGGEFQAIISIQVHDARKLRQVKQAVDLQLAVGPSPISVGGKESVDSSHAEALQDTEITISVNWSGGGEIKPPEDAWTLQTVVRAANAFPSKVARCSSRTQAILSRYESLSSFQTWKWKMYTKDQEKWKDFQILNYAPCSLYTADLFDAMMNYKKLWKKIGEMLQDPSRWKQREPAKDLKLITNGAGIAPPGRVGTIKSGSLSTETPLSPCQKKATTEVTRTKTFDIHDDMIARDWELAAMNANRDPIPVEPIALNEARLLCREAMTLITQEAARLVDHPHLAYAEFHSSDNKTQMKRPNYAYPEVLKARLPIPANNDAADSGWTDDQAARMVRYYSRDSDLFCRMDGHIRPGTAEKSLISFCSLDLNENPARNRPGNFLTQICLHSYHHHDWNVFSDWDHKSDGAIGAIGFRFAHDDPQKEEHQHTSTSFLSNASSSPHACHSTPYGHVSHDEKSQRKFLNFTSKSAPVDIQELVVYFMPGSGRIAGLTFLDDKGVERLSLRQWESDGGRRDPPVGMETVRQWPPRSDAGERWQFVGLAGTFVDSSARGQVLVRVGAIWRRA